MSECCWGITCRTCFAEIVFGTFDNHDFVAKDDFYNAGAFKCARNHRHVYFAEDIIALSRSEITSHQDIEKNRSGFTPLLAAL
jgi:hypothetical protein